MNTSLTTFLKIGVTVVVIAALLFSVGYSLIDEETKDYAENKIANDNYQFDTSGAYNRGSTN